MLGLFVFIFTSYYKIALILMKLLKLSRKGLENLV